jgi:hypothetical protein
MSDGVAPSTSAHEVGSPQADPLIVAMLRSGLVMHQSADAWVALLKQRLFSQGRKRPDKAEVKRRRDLASQAGFLFLQIIWRESELVGDADLAAVGMERGFSDHEPLNCHALAIESTDDPKEVDKLDKRIRCIVQAAKHHGLVVERRIGPKKIALEGTKKLHDLLEGHYRRVRPAIAAAQTRGIV